jgi:hypothetical protein
MRSIVGGTVDLFGGTSEVRNDQRRIVSRARELRLDMRRLFDEKGRPNAVWVFYEAVRVVSSAVYERLLRGMRRLAGEGSQSRGDECPPRVASRRLFGASCDIVGGMRHPRAVPHCRAATCVTCPRWYASSWRTFTSSQRRCVGHGGGTWREHAHRNGGRTSAGRPFAATAIAAPVPSIALSGNWAAFTYAVGSTVTPPPQAIAITRAGEGSLSGLTVAVDYSRGAGGWLALPRRIHLAEK